MGDLDKRDDEFAAFVFHHFGGYWTNWKVGSSVDPLGQNMAKLPERIERRVKELAREHLTKEAATQLRKVSR